MVKLKGCLGKISREGMREVGETMGIPLRESTER